MNQSLSAYSEYKPAGLPWLAEVPAHWSVTRLKNLFIEVDRRSGSGDEPLLSLSKSRGLIRQNELSDKLFSVADLSNYKVCEPGQIVMNRMQAWNGMFAIASETGLVSPDYSVLKSITNASVPFLLYLLKSPLLVARFVGESKGLGTGFNRLYFDRFGAIYAQLPPLPEQQRIVAFLDGKTRQIARLLRNKRQLIKLLTEQKQALIHRAVTQGLDPNAPRKDSGVAWLGEVPVHWELQKAKFLAHIKTGGKDTENKVEGGTYPFFVRSQTVERINSFSFEGEAVLTAGDGAGVGKVFHYVNERFDYHQRVYKYSNFKRVTGKFFYHYLKTNLQFEALDASAKSTVDSLRLPMLQNFLTTVPPEREQQQIVEYIESETELINQTISRAQREIELIQEYRTRLIADVVTGQVDISHLADTTSGPELPAEDELDLDDEIEEEILTETEDGRN